MKRGLPVPRTDTPSKTFTRRLEAQRTQRLDRQRAAPQEFTRNAQEESGWPPTPAPTKGTLKPGPGDRS